MTDADVPRDRKLTVDELRAWLDRKPEPQVIEVTEINTSAYRARAPLMQDKRDWYEFSKEETG